MQTYADKKSQGNQSSTATGKARNEQQRDSSPFQHVDNRPEAIQMRNSQEPAKNSTRSFAPLADNRQALGQVGQVATQTGTAEPSQVIQGVFVQDNQTFLWADTDTNKVYRQTSTMSGGRVSLTADNGESFVIERGIDGTWNRVGQQAQVTLNPVRDRAYRVHADFTGFNGVDTLREDEEMEKDDLPYSAHGKIRDQEFRDFFSDIPSLPKGEQPSEGYRKLLDERTRAYGTLAQPAPPKEDFNKRPYASGEKHEFSVDASGGLPFHQADDYIKSSYQRKDKLEKNLTVHDLYEAQYLSNFNQIVPESALYAPFTQAQQSDHWLTTLGPTLDVNFPPTISDKSAGTDYKGVHSVFKNFLDKLSANPDFITKTAEDTQLFLDGRLTAVATDAHKEAYLASKNKQRSKGARQEGTKSRKRTHLTAIENKNLEQAHADISSFLQGTDVEFPSTKMARNVQKIAYLFYIKLIKRAIANVVMLMHSNIQFHNAGRRGADQQIRHGIEQILNELMGHLPRLADLQSKLYTGSNDQASDSEDDDEYEPYLPHEVQQLAQQNGVEAHYGGSHGNNCLIFAIAGAFGVALTEQAAAEIRTWLNNHSAQNGHFNAHGQLPMLPGLIQEITNRLALHHNINGNVTVVTTQGNFNAQGAVANNANNGNVLVILHGGHYYFTQAPDLA